MKRHHHDDDDDENRPRSRRIIRDGEAVRVGMFAMDGADAVQRAIAAARPHVTDSDGGSAGLHRPGFRVVANDARQAIYDAYDAEVSAAYLTGGCASEGAEVRDATPLRDSKNMTLDQLQHEHDQRMGRIYAQRDEELRNAWRATP